GARHLAAVFTPIFFVSLGLQVNVPAVAAQTGLIPLAAALTVVAVITKVVGCSLPARIARMTAHEAVAIGWGMTPRGEVGLIVHRGREPFFRSRNFRTSSRSPFAR